MAKKTRGKKGPKSIEGFDMRDQHGQFEGLDGITQGNVVVHGPQMEDVDGKISSPYRVRDTLDILLANDRIDKGSWDAGKRFAEDFDLGALHGVKAVDWFATGGSPKSVGGPPKAVEAADRVMSAIKHLGGVGRPQAEVAWHILGLGQTIKAYSEANQLLRGRPGNPHFISGLVVGACGSLVSHYRLG